VELVVVIVLLLLLVAMIVPNFIRARVTSAPNSCVANLRQIDGAKEQWALEHKKPIGTPADPVAVNRYLKGGQAPTCPADGVYTYNPLGTLPTCSLGATLGHSL
jgi:competence protein ComGC